MEEVLNKDKVLETKNKKEVRKNFQEEVVKSSEKESVNSMLTYTSIEHTEEKKLLEFDLVYVRQKGESEKFLEVTLTEVVSVQGEAIANPHVFEIKSKEEFMQLKDYFVNLNWE